jgi:hypothetical protein
MKMDNIKCVERTFYFGRVKPSSDSFESDDIFTDWKVTFRLISLTKIKCEILSFKLSLTFIPSLIDSKNEVNEALALQYLLEHYTRMQYLAGMRDRRVKYSITEDLNKNSDEFKEYMRGYNKAEGLNQ